MCTAISPFPSGAARLQRHGLMARPSERIVYVVSSNLSRVEQISHSLRPQEIMVRVLVPAAGCVADEIALRARDCESACVILDLDCPESDCPELDGFELQRELIDGNAPPVIFVTDHADALTVVRAIKNGAIDFMMEPLDCSELMTAIERGFAVDRKKRSERKDEKALLSQWNSLTPREAEVFRHTTSGLLNKQACAELGITENTYQVHRGRVMKKMRANSLADLVRMSTKLDRVFRRMRCQESVLKMRSVLPYERGDAAGTYQPLMAG